jgi:hypothetical protein
VTLRCRGEVDSRRGFGIRGIRGQRIRRVESLYVFQVHFGRLQQYLAQSSEFKVGV